MSGTRSLREMRLFNLQTKLARFFSWSALGIGSAAVLLVLSSYVCGYLQPVRWPTLFYFELAFIVTLISERRGVMLVTFLLPLVPTLHWQLQFFYHPAVPYFVTAAGIDLVTGLTCALFIKHLNRPQSLRFNPSTIPWPIGLLAWVISLSTALAIARNLWRSASRFELSTFLHETVRFKLFVRGNDFSPIGDWLAVSLALLFLAMLADSLLRRADREQLIFKPAIASLFVSACYGIYQAFTKIGLPQAAVEYRPESFGYSAIGFQPDIHAYAGHMLLGSVGLFGVLKLLKSNRWRYFAYVTIVLCWIALYLSKSRASLVFSMAVFAVIILLLARDFLRNKSKVVGFTCAATGFALIALLISLSPWLQDAFIQIQDPKLLTFEHLNLLTSRRLELFAAALRMFSSYPLMGLGQGNFLLSSAVVPFSHSVWMSQSGGENAHNYFLQILADVGIVGAGCYLLVLLWPLCRTKNLRALIPAAVAILGLCLGNLYSHSFIIRDNLLLLCAFMALGYSYAYPRPVASGNVDFHATRCKLSGKIIVLIIAIVMSLIPFAFLEVATSFDRLPFQQSSHR